MFYTGQIYSPTADNRFFDGIAINFRLRRFEARHREFLTPECFKTRPVSL